MSRPDYLALSDKFETYLTSHQPYGSPDTLYEPIRYINESGGKRIRPVLLLMAYNLWHEDVTPALPAAMAIEYFHNFSLMHDDIMDEAPLRRGRITAHQQFGRNSAMLSGDALLIRCFDLLIEAGKPNNNSADLCSLMCKAALEICEGQQMDMDFESLDSPTEPEYLEMIRKKTACLMGTSLQMGAMLAGADHQYALSLYHFGEKVGLGFQVQDDYLDVFGDANLTGKQKGGDVIRGKKNFMYVHTCNTLGPDDRKAFNEVYHQVALDQNLSQVLKVYDRLNVADYTYKIQSELIEKGMSYLQSLPLSGVSALVDFTEKLLSRDH